MCKVISVANIKGGVAKTTTAANLGVGLVKKGKRVLLVDLDPQGSLSLGLGIRNNKELPYTVSTVIQKVINEIEISEGEGIIHNDEGVDILPSNHSLRTVEQQLDEVMSKEHILEEYIDGIRDRYDYIIIDCNPGVDNLILNALTCCDSVLIPSPPEYLCVEGLQEIIRTIGQVKKRLNRKIEIEGVLLTIVNGRTNIARDIMNKMEEAYGQHLKIFQTVIPESVKAKEAVANESSIKAELTNYANMMMQASMYKYIGNVQNTGMSIGTASQLMEGKLRKTQQKVTEGNSRLGSTPPTTPITPNGSNNTN